MSDGRAWKGLEGLGRAWKGLEGLGRAWKGLGGLGRESGAGRFICRSKPQSVSLIIARMINI